MARYIDATQLQAKILDASIKNKLSESREVLKIFDKMVQDMPTADVVPKSEVDEMKKDRYHILPDGRIELIPRSDVKALEKEFERLQNILDSYALQYGTVMDKHTVIDKERAVVAREIFEEIEEIAMHGVTPLGLCLMSMGEAAFAELKKKYTEGE